MKTVIRTDVPISQQVFDGIEEFKTGCIFLEHLDSNEKFLEAIRGYCAKVGVDKARELDIITAPRDGCNQGGQSQVYERCRLNGFKVTNWLRQDKTLSSSSADLNERGLTSYTRFWRISIAQL